MEIEGFWWDDILLFQTPLQYALQTLNMVRNRSQPKLSPETVQPSPAQALHLIFNVPFQSAPIIIRCYYMILSKPFLK